MNRSERRRLEKQNRIRNENRKLIDAIAQDTENQRVEALMTCFALAMREEFGFGKKRVLRALRRVDRVYGYMDKGRREPCISQTKGEGRNRNHNIVLGGDAVG